MLHVFDADTRVQHWMPENLSFPLYASVDISLVPVAAQQALRALGYTQPRPLVLLASHNVAVPHMVQVWTEEFEDAFHIPWNACSPDLTLLPN